MKIKIFHSIPFCSVRNMTKKQRSMYRISAKHLQMTSQHVCACECLMEPRASLSSTSALIVPVLVSREQRSSCAALILTGKRREHKCSAAAAIRQPTTCQKCRVTLRATTWPRNAPVLLDYTVGPHPSCIPGPIRTENACHHTFACQSGLFQPGHQFMRSQLVFWSLTTFRYLYDETHQPVP